MTAQCIRAGGLLLTTDRAFPGLNPPACHLYASLHTSPTSLAQGCKDRLDEHLCQRWLQTGLLIACRVGTFSIDGAHHGAIL